MSIRWSKCDSCKSKPICSACEKFNETVGRVGELTLSDGSLVRNDKDLEVVVNCNYFHFDKAKLWGPPKDFDTFNLQKELDKSEL